jgi:hypothetical protein
VKALSFGSIKKIVIQIKIVVEKYLILAENKPSANSGNPFIMALIGRFEPLIHRIHGMKTSMGNEMEHIAEIIAVEKWGRENVLHKQKENVRLPKNIFNEIDTIINNLSNSRTLSDYEREKQQIIIACNNPSQDYEEHTYEFDLIIKDSITNHYYILEMKGPDPNTTEVPGAKKRLLVALAWVYLNKSINVDCRLCIYYNNKFPKPYRNPKVFYYFNPDGGLLVSEEFWNFLGKHENTYNELISVFEKFGKKYKNKIWSSFSNLIIQE